jgi:hypothetical protein
MRLVLGGRVWKRLLRLLLSNLPKGILVMHKPGLESGGEDAVLDRNDNNILFLCEYLAVVQRTVRCTGSETTTIYQHKNSFLLLANLWLHPHIQSQLILAVGMSSLRKDLTKASTQTRHRSRVGVFRCSRGRAIR